MDEVQREYLPVARVAWWNQTFAHVLCSYCDAYHFHVLQSANQLPGRSSSSPLIKESQCAHKLGFSTRYALEFPFDEADGTANFEIDKTKRRYVSVECEQEDEDDPKDAIRRMRASLDHAEGLKREVAGYPLFDDAQEEFEIKEPDLLHEHIRHDSGVSLAEGLDRLTLQTRLLEENSECLKENSRRLEENFRRLDEDLSLLKLQPFASQDQLSFKGKRIHCAIDDCLNGRPIWLTLYLESTAEKEIFIKGTDVYGDTMLHQTSCLNFPDVVSLLLSHGADPNRRNLCGRTSLMEAALWGRAHVVRLLLDHGADKDIQDEGGRKAIDFANERKLARDERERRSRTNSGLVYYEDRYQSDRERKVISALLKAGPSTQAAPVKHLGIDAYALYSFHPSSSGFEQYLTGPLDSFGDSSEGTKTEAKTVARLCRGEQFEPIDAICGWSPSDGNSTTVCGVGDMTDIVLKLCDEVGFSLALDAEKDQGQPGKANACHAEKQLVAYLISRHRFTADELEPSSPLRPLENVKPPALLGEATILMSGTICSDCESFMQAVETAFAIKIRRINASFENHAKAFANEHFSRLNQQGSLPDKRDEPVDAGQSHTDWGLLL